MPMKRPFPERVNFVLLQFLMPVAQAKLNEQLECSAFLFAIRNLLCQYCRLKAEADFIHRLQIQQQISV